MNNIVELLKHASENKLILFLGPYFSVANGSLDYLEAIERIHPSPHDSSKQFYDEKDYIRYAEGCSRSLLERNDKMGFELRFAKYYLWSNPVPSALYRLAGRLPVKIVISLNLDDVFPKLARDNGISVYANEQLFTAFDDLKKGTTHLIQLLGSAREPEKIAISYSNYKKLSHKSEWVNYFSYLFTNYYPLFIGFRPKDPVAIDLLKLLKNIPEKKYWYVFFAYKPKETFHKIVKIITPEDLESSVMPISREIFDPLPLHQNFITELLEKSNKLASSSFLMLEQEEDERWEHLTESMIKKERIKTNLEEFYHGKNPSWAIPLKNMDAARDITSEIKRFLLYQELRIALLQAPAGWGKSTVARRIAFDFYAKEGFEVFWIDNPERFPESLQKKLVDLRSKDVLVVIDNTQDLSDIHLRFAHWHKKSFKRLRILLIGRTSEIASKVIKIDKLREFGSFKIFEMSWISYYEAEKFTERLQAFGQLGKLDKIKPKERPGKFIDSGNGDLLAAMLVSVTGDSLDNIMKDVCWKVRSREGGSDILKAYCLVATLESLGEPCKHRLLFKFLKNSKEDIYRYVINRLPGELDLNFFNNTIETRHKSVAEAALKALYGNGEDEVFFTRKEMYKEILDAVGEIRDFPERKLNTILPLEYKRGNITKNDAKILFTIALNKDPGDIPTYHAWALVEKEDGNIDAARKLFKEAVERDRKDFKTYHSWAIMEKEAGDIESARKLFKKVLKIQKFNIPAYHAWAIMEQEQGNIEAARKLFQSGLKISPTEKMIYFYLANLEEEQNNLDEAFKLIKKAKNIDPNDKRIQETLNRLKLLLHEVTVDQRREDVDSIISVDINAEEHGLINDEEQLSATTWPFMPRFVTDGFEFDETTIISYLLAGLGQNIKLTVALIEPKPSGLEMIYSVHRRHQYSNFCKIFFINEENLNLDHHPCELDMKKRAREVFAQYNNGFPLDTPIVKKCHAGFRSIYYPLIFKNRLLGIYVIGKWEDNLENAKLKRYPSRLKIALDLLSSHTVLKDDKTTRELLIREIKNIPRGNMGENISDEALITQFLSKGKQGIKIALHRIDRTVSFIHEIKNSNRTSEFMAELDRELKLPKYDPDKSAMHWSGVKELLDKLRSHLNAEYVGLFLSAGIRERYLNLIDISWRESSEQHDKRVYLDKKESKIPDDLLTSSMWSFQQRKQDVLEKGIRGSDKFYFKETISWLTPFSILGHTGAIFIGNLKNSMTEEQRTILNRLCYFFGLQLAGIGLLKNYHNQRDKERIGYSFFVHQFRKEHHNEIAIHNYLSRFFVKKSSNNIEEWREAERAWKALHKNSELFAKVSRIELDKRGSLSFLRRSSYLNQPETQDIFSDTLFLLEPIVKNIEEKIKKQFRNKNFHIIFDKKRDQKTSTRIEPFILHGVIDTLLTNAVEYSKNKSEIYITWLKEDKEFTRFLIQNIGNNIDNEIQYYINNYDLKFIKDDTRRYKSYGLSLAKDAVRMWNGELSLDVSELDPPDESFQKIVFSFTIPTA